MLQKKLSAAKTMLCCTVAAFAASSASLSFVPFTMGIREGNNNTLSYIIAAVFWAGLLAGIVLSFVTTGILRKLRKNHAVTRWQDRIPGAIYFQAKSSSLVLYAVTVIGILLMVTDICFGYMPQVLMLLIVSLTVFTFELHCVLDGKNYRVYKLTKESERNEKKRKY